ncbi:MAG: fibronectin type III domain-containing protein [Pseudomonadota bacterium]|nr:fibronectin type III domain-containing protein [Pseudomonadota bacterium]
MKLFTQKKLVVALSVLGMGVSFNAMATSTGTSLNDILTTLEEDLDLTQTATVPRPERIKPKEGVRNFFSAPAEAYLNIDDGNFPNFPADVSADDNDGVNFTAVCVDNWGGNQMVGMKVTFSFADAPSAEGILTDNNNDNIVEVEMENWRFYQDSDTFRRTWHLEPVGDERPTITGIKLESVHAGNEGGDYGPNFTVFDVYFGLTDPGTPNSELGRPFEPLSWPDVLDGVPGPDGPRSVISAVYDKPVSIGVNPVFAFYNDLYAQLTIDLSPGWDGDDPVSAADDDFQGRETLPYANFIIDTDCVEGYVPDIPTAVAVVDLEAMAILSGIHLKWAAGPIDSPVGYAIYRQQDGGELQLLAVTSEPMFKDKAVESGMTYEYSVAALEAGDNPEDLALSNDAAMIKATAK